MGKVVCFGELLLRMSPELNGLWLHKESMPVFLGGAELNVAQALSLWKNDVSYVTALPDHALADDIINELKIKNIDSAGILLKDGRIGIYFLPQGADLKNSGVIYDREYSSFWNLKPGNIKWKDVLKGVSWLHFSAITPALNETLVDVCEEVLQVAGSMNITISVDLNYRSKLWKYGKDPKEVMPRLVKYCDVVMGNPWSAEILLDIPINKEIEADYNKGSYLREALNSANALKELFPKCKQVAYTFRLDEERGVRYYGALMNEAGQFVSKEFYSDQVIDKVGSGDCFMAGLIHGFTHGFDPGDIINFSSAAAFGKLHVKGDVTNQSTEAIKKILNEN
ncbi:MAG: PfkB family carbohydrate kinase [Flavitalea sp.]